MRADQWWEQDGEIRYRRAGGIIGIPRNQVDRIERTQGGTPAPSRTVRPSGTAAQSGRATRGGRTADPPAVGLQPPEERAGADLLAGGPEAWRARLKDLESRMGGPGGDEPGSRHEAAVLYTLLGNDAARSGDLDAAESSYRLASDNDPSLMAPLLNLARVRITQGRNDDAERLLDDALAARPDEPAAVALKGEVAYRSDRLDEAVELWERSLATRPDADLAARLQKAKKEMQVEEGYYRSGAPHFTVKYDGDKASEALSREILDHLESTYGDLTSRFNVYPASVIIVILYPREAFYDVTESPKSVAGLFDGQIRIPVGGLTRLTAPARSVFTHEATHAIVWHKTRGNCPRWLQEGIAQWVEGKTARGHASDLARQFAQRSPSDVPAAFSYPMALSLVEFFLETWSFSHLIDVLDALGKGSDIDAAFMTATGDGGDAFFAAWIRRIQAGEARP